jgi:hypothetical protein
MRSPHWRCTSGVRHPKFHRFRGGNKSPAVNYPGYTSYRDDPELIRRLALGGRLGARLFFACKRLPPEAKGVGRLVVLALNEEGAASGVEPEHFVIKVETCGNKLQTPPVSEAALGIHLEVREQILIASGSVDRRSWGYREDRSARGITGHGGVAREIPVLVRENVRTVVSQTNTNRESATIKYLQE